MLAIRTTNTLPSSLPLKFMGWPHAHPISRNFIGLQWQFSLLNFTNPIPMAYANKFLHSIWAPSGSSSREENIYEETNVCAKRARQILEQRRAEFNLEVESMDTPHRLAQHEASAGESEDKAWRETLAEEYEKKPTPFETAQAEYRADALVYTYHEAHDMLDSIQANLLSI